MADRARYVKDLVYQPGAQYISTDYTSFEAHFSSSIIKICEVQLYKYMTRLLPCRDRVDMICKALYGVNTLNFQSMSCKVTGVRMSGDMCTSLGNGFTNLMMMMFWAHENCARVTGVVEGDDGLFRVTKVPEADFFRRLGFTIKIEASSSLAEAQFCSMCFNEENCRVLCDPIKKVLNTGWTFSDCRFSAKARCELLRGKAISLLCECPGVPVVHSLAKWIYRTLGVGAVRYSGLSGSFDHYEEMIDINEDRVAHGLTQVPTLTDRQLVEKHFGIPMFSQLKIEEWFDNCESIRTIPYRLFADLVPPNSVKYAATHVFDVVGTPILWRR